MNSREAPSRKLRLLRLLGLRREEWTWSIISAVIWFLIFAMLTLFSAALNHVMKSQPATSIEQAHK
jgi:hypothetical protein